MHLCGIDEAGRGPLAGPVTAAAVVLSGDFPTALLADSKRLASTRREELVLILQERALAWAIGWASHGEIDSLNILRASHLAMRRALCQLLGEHPELHPVRAIVDGSICPELEISAEAIVKADASIPAVMAASILAKVARDRWMTSYDTLDPRYEFAAHKGYPTPRHRALLTQYGPSSIHRRSFSPVRAAARGPDHGPADPDGRPRGADPHATTGETTGDPPAANPNPHAP